MTFKFANLEHFIATGFADVKKEAAAVSSYLTKHQSQINAAGETAAAIVGVVDPALATAAVAAERGGEAAFAAITKAITADSAAALANGVNVQLDAAAVAAFHEAITAVKAVKPSLTTPPAGAIATPTPAAAATH